MTDRLKLKYAQLKKRLKDFKSAVVAFSGGLDSGLLTKVCFDVLDEKAIAVTAVSPTYPEQDLQEAKIIAATIGVKHVFIETEEFKNKEFIKNPLNRCYWCKKELFHRLEMLASKYKFKYILDGTNYDDTEDIRPGLKANREFGVVSPLYDCQLTKKDIRTLSRHLNLSFADKPSGTCLSSRIPFGEKITLKRIKRVGAAEAILEDFLGRHTLVRARDHNDILRIELAKREWTKLQNSDISNIVKELKKLGYAYITFDLEGYIPAGRRATR